LKCDLCGEDHERIQWVTTPERNLAVCEGCASELIVKAGDGGVEKERPTV